MSHPIYLDGNPIIGHITWMCPDCMEELHRNQECPHCGKVAVGLDKREFEGLYRERMNDE